MRTHVADFDCLVPRDVHDALRLMAEGRKLLPIAGGTDVMVWLNFGQLPRATYLSLHPLASDWRFVHASAEGGLRIGALATYSDVRRHPVVREKYPLLIEAARVTGALQIQNRGTLAGNVANGSPAADSVPVLMVYDAEVALVSVNGERRVPLHEFYTGYRQTCMNPDELIAELVLPPPRFAPARQYFRKVGTRAAQAISKVVLAAARNAHEARLAWGSVGPTTFRAFETEKIVASGADFAEAWSVLEKEISCIDDIRSTADYRRKVSCNVFREFLSKSA